MASLVMRLLTCFTRRRTSIGIISRLPACQRGASCLKVAQRADIAGTINTISTWNIDFNMPILKGDDRKYVDDLIYVKED